MSRIVVRSTGAFDRWRDEVRAGIRTTDEPVDALFRAALCDANGLDALDDGMPELAQMLFEESATILLVAASKASSVA